MLVAGLSKTTIKTVSLIACSHGQLFRVVERQGLPLSGLAAFARSHKRLFRVAERQGLPLSGLAAFARSY